MLGRSWACDMVAYPIQGGAINNPSDIPRTEVAYLRDLAKIVREYSELPVMAERTRRWYDHNARRGETPMIVMETLTFAGEFLPPLRCESSLGRAIEEQLVTAITNHTEIDDDKVITPRLTVGWDIHFREFDLDVSTDHATDAEGRSIGYAFQNPIEDLARDFHKLGPSVYSVDREATLARKNAFEDVVAGILTVEIQNQFLVWYLSVTGKIFRLMALDNYFLAMLDSPDELHRLMQFLHDDALAFIRWCEAEGLLTLNNGNDYAGAGSYGFSDELPASDAIPGQAVRMQDCWFNINSQETVGVSPKLYHEFVHGYYASLAEHFGLVYYGCCEPVHLYWDMSLSTLPNLRKISISPWCDEAFMGEALSDRQVIYSRKPSPNFIGVGRDLDEDAFAAHIKTTLAAAQNCCVEFIFRDVYTLTGDTTKPGRAVAITRELIDRHWNRQTPADRIGTTGAKRKART